MTTQEQVNSIIKEAEAQIREILGREVVLVFDKSSRHSEVLDIDKVIALAAEYYGEDVSAITGKRRTSELVRIRMYIAYYCLKERRAATYVRVGQKLGGRDHSTIVSNIQSLTSDMSIYPDVSLDYDAFSKFINSKL